jgi:hypothetical protein
MTAIAALIAVAALAVGIAYAAGVGHSTSSSGGPLALPPEKKVSMGIPVQKGVPFSFELLDIQNKSDKPVVLDRVDLVRADPGLVLVGSFGLIRPQDCSANPKPVPKHCFVFRWADGSGKTHVSRRTAIGLVKGYHFPHDGHLIRGMTIAPNGQAQVIVGVKTTMPGRRSFRELALSYHEGSKSYRDIYESSARLCAPAKKYINRCSGLLTDPR